MTQKLNSSSNSMKTIKFLYSYGGKIVPRPIDLKLRYAGGHTRVLSVDRSITYSELMVKFGELCGSSMNLKCRLPSEDLDLLVSIKSDEELRSVIEEYERISPAEKIRAVLFPIGSAKKASVPSSPMSCFDFPSSAKARVTVHPPPAAYRAAVQRSSFPAKKVSPPSSPMSCLDFPFASKMSRGPFAAVYNASPPSAVVRRFSYPMVGYPVVAGKSRYCQARSPIIRAWASMCKLGGDDDDDKSRPVFDRDLLKDPLGLSSMYWNDSRDIPLKVSSFPLPTTRFRATYVLNQSKIKKLKDSVLERFPGFVHPSSFVMVAAYVWSCLAKSLKAGEDEGDKISADDGETEYFLFPADGRARLDPPLPGNYFGNCLTFGLVNVSRLELVGAGGFFVAAEAIADEIKNKVNDKEKILKGAENAKEEFGSLLRKRVFSVSGSARVDLYGADFGWGKARKMETLSIDRERYSMSICKSRDGEGGLEVGLSLPRVNMDAFAALFADGMQNF